MLEIVHFEFEFWNLNLNVEVDIKSIKWHQNRILKKFSLTNIVLKEMFRVKSKLNQLWLSPDNTLRWSQCRTILIQHFWTLITSFWCQIWNTDERNSEFCMDAMTSTLPVSLCSSIHQSTETFQGFSANLWRLCRQRQEQIFPSSFYSQPVQFIIISSSSSSSISGDFIDKGLPNIDNNDQ